MNFHLIYLCLPLRFEYIHKTTFNTEYMIVNYFVFYINFPIKHMDYLYINMILCNNFVIENIQID